MQSKCRSGKGKKKEACVDMYGMPNWTVKKGRNIFAGWPDKEIEIERMCSRFVLMVILFALSAVKELW